MKMGSSEEKLYDESESESESESELEYSDDSQEDPDYDGVEETRLTFSNLSLKRKIKTRDVKGIDETCDEPSDVIEMAMPELNEDDLQSHVTIQKIIEGGQVERLKVDQCKIYLRKHGLRLGNKKTLILRIKEHIDVVNGGGEKKYPASSFVFNCKGDACMGDIVMFEQNVYEVFNLASHRATGPPCGTRVVAGRIVKESYGAAKQQHTFTIEVLWSKGEKPLGPLHQLLIKGRNLYKLKTMRQRWEDEGERQRMLSEKHARGGVARSNREACIKQKEMRKAHKPPTRATRAQHSNAKQEVAKTMPSLHSVPEKMTSQYNLPDQKILYEQKMHPYNAYTGTSQPKRSTDNPKIIFEGVLGRRPLGSNINCEGFVRPSSLLQPVTHVAPPPRGNWDIYGRQIRTDYFTATSPIRVYHHQTYSGNSNHVQSKENQQVGYERKRACRYYAQGRCNFGDRCKFSHELA